MSEYQSSLFAGMNVGRKTSKKVDKDESSQDGEAISSENDSVPTASNSSSSTSQFSFISETIQFKENNSELVNSPSLIDCFEMGNEEQPNAYQLSVSYVDQLAEILPMTAPLPNTENAEKTGAVWQSITYNLDNKLHCNVEKDEHEDNQQIDNEGDFKVNSDNTKGDSTTSDGGQKIKSYDVELLPEDHLHLFNSQHSYKIGLLREDMTELQHKIKAVYTDLKNDMTLLQGKLSKLRMEFEKALSGDDYDLAAEINDQIEEMNGEKLALGNARGLIEPKIVEYLVKLDELREREKEFHSWVLIKYQSLYEQQNMLLQKHGDDYSNEINKEKDDLAREKDKLERSLEHLHLDKEHLDKDRADLDNRINAKLEVFLTKKDDLVNKKSELEVKISVLEKKLRLLNEEKITIDSLIKIEDDKIAVGRKEFQDVEAKLDEECNEVLQKERNLNMRLDEIVKIENDLDERLSEQKKKEQSFLDNLKNLQLKKEQSEEFLRAIQNDKKFTEIFPSGLKPQDCGDDLVKLQKIENVKAQELESLELHVFNKVQLLSSKRKRMKEIQDQLPRLDLTKKDAVHERNFKEAKQINEMMKALTEEFETLVKDVKDNETEVKMDEEKIKLLKEENAVVKKNVLEAKHNYELTTNIQLAKRMKRFSEINTDAINDDFLRALKEEEIDLIKTELGLLDEPSEEILSTLNKDDVETIEFMKQFLTS